MTKRGTIGNDEIIGSTKSDTLYGRAGNDVLDGLAGNDKLYGEEGDDKLGGGAGNDTLDGGIGADTMDGGIGNDVYIVDDANDLVIEADGSGTDHVKASISYRLNQAVEWLTLTGNAAIDGIGNDLANVLRGNSGNNSLDGLGGNDSIYGGDGQDIIDGGDGNDSLSGESGNDTLIGGQGNDTLDGGTGSDHMEGGNDDDLYLVDNASDIVIERSGMYGGTDSIRSTVNYRLTENVENLQLIGTNAGIGIGNALDNALRAGSGDQQLQGLDGDDTILAGDGQDVLDGGTGDDVLRGEGGSDTLRGGTGRDDLDGGTGDDMLAGGAGSDILRGSTGADQFVFAAADAAGGATDAITDLNFLVGDSIVLTGFGKDGERTLRNYADLAMLIANLPGASVAKSASSNLQLLLPTDAGTQRINIADKSGSGSSWVQYKAAFAALPAPTTNVDEGNVSEGSSTVIDVLGNDNGHGLSLTLESVRQMTGNGQVTIENGKIRFATDDAFEHLAAGRSEKVEIDYIARNAVGLSTTGRLTVTVTGNNDGATITGTTNGSATEDSTSRVSGKLAAVDIDNGEAAFRVLSDAWGTYGQISLSEDGAWEYKLDNTNAAVQALGAGQSLTDLMTVHSIDGTPKLISIEIHGTNDAPIVKAAIDSASVAEDSAWTFRVPAETFADVDGQALVLTATLADGSPLPGWLQFNSLTQTFTGTPITDWNGKLSLAVSASDGSASTTTIFDLKVNAVNDAPVAVIDRIEATEDVRIKVAIADLLANDIDPDGDLLDFLEVSAVENLAFDGISDGYLVFTPARDFNGNASFTYGIRDTSGATGFTVVTVKVAPFRDFPVVSKQITTQTATEDTPWLFTVPSGTFTDPDGDTLTLSATKGDGSPLPSWLVFDSVNQQFLGTPPKDWNGNLDIELLASDGQYGAGQIFRLTVTPVADAPSLATPILDQHLNEDQSWSFTIPSSTFVDVDGDLLVLSATLGNGAPLPEWLEFNSKTGHFSGRPPQDFYGKIELKVTASDGLASRNDTFQLIVAPVSDPTKLASFLANITIDEDSSQSFSIASNFTDPDTDANHPLEYSAKLAGGGELPSWLRFDRKTGEFSTQDTKDFNGKLDIAVTAFDPSDRGFTNGNFVLTVRPINDGPRARSDVLNMQEDGNNVSHFFSAQTLLSNDTDIDGDELSIVGFSNQTHGTVRNSFGSGNYWFDLDDNFVGVAGFDYTVRDSAGALSTTHVTINVAAVQDAPSATNDYYMTTGNSIFLDYSSLLGNDVDVDGDSLTITGFTLPAASSDYRISTTGQKNTISFYKNKADWYGKIPVEYQISDGHGGTSKATVTVDFNAAPKAAPVSWLVFKGATDAAEGPYSWYVNGRYQFNILANTSDPNGDYLKVQSVYNLTHVKEAKNPFYDDRFELSFEDGFVGLASLDFTVVDSKGATSASRAYFQVVDPYITQTTSIIAYGRGDYYLKDELRSWLSDNKNPGGYSASVVSKANVRVSNVTAYADEDGDLSYFSVIDASKDAWFEFKVKVDYPGGYSQEVWDRVTIHHYTLEPVDPFFGM